MEERLLQELAARVAALLSEGLKAEAGARRGTNPRGRPKTQAEIDAEFWRRGGRYPGERDDRDPFAGPPDSRPRTPQQRAEDQRRYDKRTGRLKIPSERLNRVNPRQVWDNGEPHYVREEIRREEERRRRAYLEGQPNLTAREVEELESLRFWEMDGQGRQGFSRWPNSRYYYPHRDHWPSPHGGPKGPDDPRPEDRYPRDPRMGEYTDWWYEWHDQENRRRRAHDKDVADARQRATRRRSALSRRKLDHQDVEEEERRAFDAEDRARIDKAIDTLEEHRRRAGSEQERKEWQDRIDGLRRSRRRYAEERPLP